MLGHHLQHYRGAISGVSTIHDRLRGLISLTGTQGVRLEETRALMPTFGTTLGVKSLPSR